MNESKFRLLIAVFIGFGMVLGQCTDERVIDSGTFKRGFDNKLLLSECKPESTVTLTLEVLPEADVPAYYEELTGEQLTGPDVIGFWILTTKRHRVIVPEVNRIEDDRLMTWGHELAHVACGHFHD